MKPGDPTYTHLKASGQTIHRTEITDLANFMTGTTNVLVGDEVKSIANNKLALYTAATINGLTVTDSYTTQDGDNKGAITLTCTKDGVTFTVRTVVMREDGELVTADRFMGKTIDVSGIIESFTPEGSTEAKIQIKVFTINNITIH